MTLAPTVSRAPRVGVAARLAGLATVTAWGSAFVAIRAAGETMSPGPLALGRVRDVKEAGAAAIGWIVYLGLVPTSIGFAAWAFALRRTSSGRMGAMLYLIPSHQARLLAAANLSGKWRPERP